MSLIRTLPPIDGRIVMLGLVLPYYEHARWLEGAASASVEWFASAPPRVAFRLQLLSGTAWSRRRDYRRALERERRFLELVFDAWVIPGGSRMAEAARLRYWWL